MRHRNAFFAVDQLASHADQLLRVILQTRREYREKGMLIHRMKTTYLTGNPAYSIPSYPSRSGGRTALWTPLNLIVEGLWRRRSLPHRPLFLGSY